MKSSTHFLRSTFWIGGSLFAGIAVVMLLDRWALRSSEHQDPATSLLPAAVNPGRVHRDVVLMSAARTDPDLARDWAALAPTPLLAHGSPATNRALAAQRRDSTNPTSDGRGGTLADGLEWNAGRWTVGPGGSFLSAGDFRRTSASGTAASENNSGAPTLDATPRLASRPARAVSSWPAFPKLHAMLNELPSGVAETWRRDTQDALYALETSGSLYSAASSELLERLATLHLEAVTLVKSMPSTDAREDLWRAAYALQRRLDVWSAARDSLGRPDLEIAARGLVNEALTKLESRLQQQAEGATWRQYLLCEPVRDCLRQPASGEHRELARRAIRRLTAAQRDARYRDWLRDASFEQWARALRAWAVLPIDSAQLVHDLESFETQASPRERRELADLLDALQATQADGDVLQQLDAHYRNANLAVAVSGALVQWFAPANATPRAGGRDDSRDARSRSESSLRPLPVVSGTLSGRLADRRRRGRSTRFTHLVFSRPGHAL